MITMSCGLPPSAQVVGQAQLAERLGYRRVWLFDAPALYGDLWAAMARIATSTSRIGLGAGVTIPSLRHPMVTASAIGSIAELAPGRLVVALGTGYSGLAALGRRPLSWNALAEAHRQIRALLDGDVVEIDGRPCQMMQLPDHGPERPIDVPLWLAADGPKGRETAARLDVPGILTTGLPPTADDTKETALLRFGTILRPGEDHTTERVVEAAGPGYSSMVVHATWQRDPQAVDGLPGGGRWRSGIEAERPEDQRHLIVHQGHLIRLTDRDREVVEAAGPAIFTVGWHGDAASVAARIDQASEAGVTEIIYVPTGPDLAAELIAFAEVNAGRDQVGVAGGPVLGGPR